MADDFGPPPVALTPLPKPLSLIPVGLKEAALDSPTFRASALHFAEQLELVEAWLQNYIRSASRLANEVTSLESLINTYVSHVQPPPLISESLIDPDYTVLALRRYGEGAREFWNATLKWMKKVESTVVDPIKAFIGADLINLKTQRRNLEQTQRNFDSLMARYAGQSKTKEASSLREDAFQLYEARRAYLKASMDFCTSAPQIRSSLDKLLVKIFSDRWRDMRTTRDALANSFGTWANDMDRVRGWSKEMENYETIFKKELQLARKTIEDSAENATRPSRELDDYAISTVPYIGAPQTQANASPRKQRPEIELAEKQGWLFQRTTAGKPARTVWVRRWFYAKNGIFGWLAQSSRGVEESEKTGVLLCGIRPVFQEERRFCFEVKTNLASFILQAETQNELMDWISAFEGAKRKALENPASSDAIAAGSRSIDPAFAITPPVAPEFAAKTADMQGSDDTGVERSATMNALGADLTPLASRSSMDMSSRRSITGERDPDSSTARIIQKLDLHRKGAGESRSASTSNPAGGIASLISASHNLIPIGAVTGPPAVSVTTDFKALLGSHLPHSSLAPSTLATAPTPTNLSKLAVIISGDRGPNAAPANDGDTPGGLMANLWGTNNWGYLSRLQSGEISPDSVQERGPLEPVPPSPGFSTDAEPSSLDEKQFSHPDRSMTMDAVSAVSQAPSHKKSNSLSTTISRVEAITSGSDYPNYYPMALKAQDAQFRLLIPQKSANDRLVLVFRAAWSANDQQEFPGRVYLTQKEIFFYSNHMGLVLISNIRLTSVDEVTAAPGKDCDFLFVHLKEGARRDGATRLTIKVFLEPLRLLQRRLNYLVRKANSREIPTLQETIKHLIKMETEKGDESPSIDSWEEVDANTPFDGVRGGRDIKTGLRIDGTLYPDPNRKISKNATKFRLPSHPVEFAPPGFDKPVTEKEFDITAKALFHVLAGDKSAVFQILYCESCAERLTQTPWYPSETNRQMRQFKFEVKEGQITQEVVDYQIIDVLNDHLCYVITDRRFPWFLPYAKDFTLLSKIVITHVAKSRCKLAIYTKVDWTKQPMLGRSLIESRARFELYSTAVALREALTDQVSRLGVHNNSNSRKALQIYGKVGEQVQGAQQFVAADLPPVPVRNIRKLKARSLPGLAAQSTRRMLVRTVMSLLGLLFQMLKAAFSIVNANRVLVLALLVSALYNLFFTQRDTWTWWRERRAGKFMARMGVVPNPVLGRSVWSSDLQNWVQGTASSWTLAHHTYSPCAAQFQTLINQTDPSFSTSITTSTSQLSTSTRLTVDRLQRTRHRYGTYRHDLLVALGVVDRMEKESVRAEYESWAYGEAERCRQIKRVLKKGNKTDSVEIQSRVGEYCGSCQAETRSGYGSP